MRWISSASTSSTRTTSVTIVDENSGEENRTLKAVDYTGNRLPVKSYPANGPTRTVVSLYLAKPSRGMSKPKGKVKVITSRGFGLDLKPKLFSGGDRGCFLNDKVLKDLHSGTFEGEIRFSDMVKLEPSRRWFEADAALMEAIDDIETWMREEGDPYIQKKEDEETNARYARYAQDSAKVIRTFMKEHPEYVELLKTFNWGHIGSQHAKVPRGEGRYDRCKEHRRVR